VVYGVRPEHIALGGADAPVQAEVIVVEPTGAETELLVQVGGAQVIVVLHGRTQVQPGDRVGLTIETEQVHLFDAQTQRAERRAS